MIISSAADRILVGLTIWLALGPADVRATTQVGSWTPLFKGVDYSISTNLPSTDGMPHLLVISAVRVDLSDSDIALLTTPRAPNYIPDSNEVGGLRVTDFLKTNHTQVAINANLFDARDYYLPAGTPMDVYGLAVSQGVVVSAQDSADDAATMVFDKSNHASVIATNWPPASTAGVYTAVSGSYPVLLGSQNISYGYLNGRDTIHDPNPRTAFGLSADRRYLYLMTIDGRQPGYSEGAYDYETAEWLLLLGAADGINLDGGGSTTLVVEDSTGFPLRLNHSSAVADSGNERTVGSHFGVFAKPLPAFINDVSVTPDDTTARITWTTTAPASSQVAYGTTADLGETSALDETPVSEHNLELTSLSPATGYYYRVLSATTDQAYVSPTRYFVTTNYVTTNTLFELEQPWRFSTTTSAGSDWITPGYEDSTWSGPGPGLLWVDVRATGPNTDVTPRNTVMPANPATGYPYLAYYVRTHFTVSNLVANSTLQVSGYVDDGAIFYLNGKEVYRLRMPDGDVTSQTLAASYPCGGDATCLDGFSIAADGLVVGDNIMAAEVHNYNARSADITFGVSLARVEPIAHTLTIQASYHQGTLTLTWQAAGALLQTANVPGGPWQDVTPAPSSPFATPASNGSCYFRLRRQPL